MTRRGPPKDVAASIRARLHNVARERGEDFQFVLLRYGGERLLYRLTRSDHAGQFVLKGSALFVIWLGHPHRPTRDMDLLGTGVPDLQRLGDMFREVCAIDETARDGLTFDAAMVATGRIREDEEYEAVRVKLEARLGNIRIPLQVDVGFGDAVTPRPAVEEYPSLLKLDPPRLATYPRETVVAEKVHAMVNLGLVNSRMKDYYDVWFLAGRFPFDGGTLADALRATFARRRLDIPEDADGLAHRFATDPEKQREWAAFLRRSGVTDVALQLPAVVALIRTFVLPPLAAARGRSACSKRWSEGAWTDALGST